MMGDDSRDMTHSERSAMEAATQALDAEIRGQMSAKVIQLRDYKRREENDADLVRLAREVMGLDTAPCEMPPVQPSYTAPESDPA
jgi:hypothetical protein